MASRPKNQCSNSTSLAALWSYLASWISPEGGVNGPVVHRSDLKRMFAIHDTPWTQQGVIAGLLHLYRRSGRDYWLNQAVRLADAQCARQEVDGRFRWAGHEDDRFSSLVHNALADCALLDVANVLLDSGDLDRRNRYLNVARKNLQDYVIGQLYRPDLCGFVMNSFDYYARRDRFIVNMNSVAIEALIKLDLQHDSDQHAALVQTVGEKILSLQSCDGICKGSLPYSHSELEIHIPLYTALALRSLPALMEYAGDSSWIDLARGALSFLNRTIDKDTGLWFHKVQHERTYRFPIFVAGAGIICNGIVDASRLTGSDIDESALAERLLRHQYPNGAIRNFIGYDHPDNGRRRGDGVACWEDTYPTPNWNAQAFHFLCRILPPPEPPATLYVRPFHVSSRRFLYFESQKVSFVVGTWPPIHWYLALYFKRFRHGLVVPRVFRALRSAVKVITKFAFDRAVMVWLRQRIVRRSHQPND